MNPNEAPTDVLHKSRLLSIVIGMGLVSCICMVIGGRPDSGLRLLFILGAGGFLFYFLFMEIQTIEFFPTCIWINYICRKQVVDHADIEDVSMVPITRTVNGVPVSSKYISMRLKSGKTLRLGGFRESAEVAYQKLKACESSNEEFLKNR